MFILDISTRHNQTRPVNGPDQCPTYVILFTNGKAGPPSAPWDMQHDAYTMLTAGNIPAAAQWDSIVATQWWSIADQYTTQSDNWLAHGACVRAINPISLGSTSCVELSARLLCTAPFWVCEISTSKEKRSMAADSNGTTERLWVIFKIDQRDH